MKRWTGAFGVGLVVGALGSIAPAAPSSSQPASSGPAGQRVGGWTILPAKVNRDPVIAINPHGIWTKSGGIYGYDGAEGRAVEGAGFYDPQAFSGEAAVAATDVELGKARPSAERESATPTIGLYSPEGRLRWRRALKSISGKGAQFSAVKITDANEILAGGALAGCVEVQPGSKACRNLRAAQDSGACTDEDDPDTCTQPLIVAYDVNGRFASSKTFPGMTGELVLGKRGDLGFYGWFQDAVDLDPGKGRTAIESAAAGKARQGFLSVVDPKGKWAWGWGLVGEREVSVSKLIITGNREAWVLAQVAEAPAGAKTAVRLRRKGEDRILTEAPCAGRLLIRFGSDGNQLGRHEACSVRQQVGGWEGPEGSAIVVGPWFAKEPAAPSAGIFKASTGPSESSVLAWLQGGDTRWRMELDDAIVRALYTDASGQLCVALSFEGERRVVSADGHTAQVGGKRAWSHLAGCIQTGISLRERR